MTERRECCICGAETGIIRFEMFRYVRFGPGEEHEGEYDAGPRCLDRDRCRAMAAAMDRRWNVDDGPAVLPRIAQRPAVAPAEPPPPEPEADPAPAEVPAPAEPEPADQEPTQIGLALQLAWSA